MSNKCRTERITHYRATLNEGGFEKGDVESIVDNWYDSNGNKSTDFFRFVKAKTTTSK